MMRDVSGEVSPWHASAVAELNEKLARAGPVNQSVLMEALRILRVEEDCESWARSLRYDAILRGALLPDARAASEEALKAGAPPPISAYAVSPEQGAAVKAAVDGRLRGAIDRSSPLFERNFHALVAFLRDRLTRGLLLWTGDVLPLACLKPLAIVELGFPVDESEGSGGYPSVYLGRLGVALSASIMHQFMFNMMGEQLGCDVLLLDVIPVVFKHNAAADVDAFVAANEAAAKETQRLVCAISCAARFVRGKVAARAVKLHGVVHSGTRVQEVGGLVGVASERAFLVHDDVDGLWEFNMRLQHPEASIADKRESASPGISAALADHAWATYAGAAGVPPPVARCRRYTLFSAKTPYYGCWTHLDDMKAMRGYELSDSGGGRVLPKSAYSALARDFADKFLPHYVDGVDSLAALTLSHWGEGRSWGAAAR